MAQQHEQTSRISNEFDNITGVATSSFDLAWLYTRQGETSRASMRMIFIPAGKFIMGDDEGQYDDEKPAHEVHVEAFYIGKYLVTNAEYRHFVQDTGHRAPDHSGPEKHPVVCVSWHDAMAYCEWLSRVSGRLVRLPTEAEWEKAASWKDESGGMNAAREEGKDNRQAARGRKLVYPWGDEFDKNRCNTSESGIGDTTPVGKYSPQGDSPYGCADMVGNVWEWCLSLYKPYPYNPQDGREDLDLRVLRGGSFDFPKELVRCACRARSDPSSWSRRSGFRVAVFHGDPTGGYDNDLHL